MLGVPFSLILGQPTPVWDLFVNLSDSMCSGAPAQLPRREP